MNRTTKLPLCFYCGTCGRLPSIDVRDDFDEREMYICNHCGEEVDRVPAGKHTPGPWGVNPDGESIFCNLPTVDTLIANLTGRAIDAAFFGQTPGEMEANANLIAAAPEMIEVLRRVSYQLRTGDGDRLSLLHQIDSLIAKVDQ